MLNGTMSPVSRRGTYTDAIQLLDAETGEPLDLTGATITVEISDDPCCRACWSATVGTGVTLPEPGVIAWRFEAEAIDRCRVGNLYLRIVIERDGDTVIPLSATLPVEC